MADKDNERDIFGPSETKPGTFGNMAGSGMGTSGTEHTSMTGMEHERAGQAWGQTHDLGTTSHEMGERGMTGHIMEGEQSKAGQAMDEVRQKAAPVIEQAKQQASDTMDRVQDRALGMLDQQKSRAADTLGSVAGALRSTGQHLNEENQASFGQYAERAANTVDNLSRQLQEKGVGELVHEAENFARREPQIFLGGAVLAGILLARFLKSSAPKPEFNAGYYGQGYAPGPGSQGRYGRSFERGSGQGYTRRERGGIEHFDQDYDESWTGEHSYPPKSPGHIT